MTSPRISAPPAGSARSPVRSTVATSASATPPSPTGDPSARRARAPSSRSAPMPPSVDELPPSARSRRGTPESSAARIARPKPRVWAVSGRSGSSSVMPLVEATSTTPVPSGSRSQRASTGRSSGPGTRMGTRRAPGMAAASTSMVPCPPSAMGAITTSSPGRARSQPRRRASAASAAVADPVSESGDMTTRSVRRAAVLMTPVCRTWSEPRSGPPRPRPRRTRSDAAAPDQSGATPARCASSAAPTSPASLPRLAAMIAVSRCRNAEKRANSCAAAPPTTMRSGDMIDSRCR